LPTEGLFEERRGGAERYLVKGLEPHCLTFILIFGLLLAALGSDSTCVSLYSGGDLYSFSPLETPAANTICGLRTPYGNISKAILKRKWALLGGYLSAQDIF